MVNTYASGPTSQPGARPARFEPRPNLDHGRGRYGRDAGNRVDGRAEHRARRHRGGHLGDTVAADLDSGLLLGGPGLPVVACRGYRGPLRPARRFPHRPGDIRGRFLASTVFTNPLQLIAARGVAGVGAAFIMPATLSLLTATYREDERAKATGIWAGVAGSGASSACSDPERCCTSGRGDPSSGPSQPLRR